KGLKIFSIVQQRFKFFFAADAVDVLHIEELLFAFTFYVRIIFAARERDQYLYSNTDIGRNRERFYSAVFFCEKTGAFAYFFRIAASFSIPDERAS
ncbi:MAG: hypothetical protein IIY32_05715, partial [Thermoguttaceae bacterium]|nr:hypothetical protein [Thermoguttaceae bacterium]